MGLQADLEWRTCSSYTRIFTALNETLSSDDMVALVELYLRRHKAHQVVPLAWVRLRGAPPQPFVSVTLVIRKLGKIAGGNGLCLDLGAQQTWVDHARDRYPKAPRGFEDIGRFANKPRRASKPIRWWPFPWAAPAAKGSRSA